MNTSAATAETMPGVEVAHWTTAEVSRRLHLHTQTLNRWRRLGKGPKFIRIEGAIRYPIEDVLAWELSGRTTRESQVTQP